MSDLEKARRLAFILTRGARAAEQETAAVGEVPSQRAAPDEPAHDDWDDGDDHDPEPTPAEDSASNGPPASPEPPPASPSVPQNKLADPGSEVLSNGAKITWSVEFEIYTIYDHKGVLVGLRRELDAARTTAATLPGPPPSDGGAGGFNGDAWIDKALGQGHRRVEQPVKRDPVTETKAGIASTSHRRPNVVTRRPR